MSMVLRRPASAVRAVGAGRRRRRRRDIGLALILLSPALTALVVMRIVPMCVALGQSLRRTSLSNGETHFVGFANYTYVLTDHDFHSVLVVTLLFNLVLNPVILVLSTGCALLLAQRIPLGGLWRSMVFVPAAVPGPVVALIWSTALQPDGLVNAGLKLVNLPPQPFLTSSHQAAFSIGMMVTWGALGYWMVFVIAGINDIPDEINEAASIDGAGWWARLWYVTLPLLRRPMTFVLMACTVGSFLLFAPIQVLTKGGPEGSTNLIMYDIFNRSYLLNDLGVGQAEVVLLLLMLSIIVAVQFRMLREDKA